MNWNEEKSTQLAERYGAADAAVDCANEPIHLAGSTQPHGFFLMLDGDAERVVVASANAESFLGAPLKLILGASLNTLVDREVLSAVRAITAGDPGGHPVYLGAYRVRDELCSIVTHQIGDRRVLEFERLDRLVIPEIMNAVITNFVSRLSSLETELDLCRSITRQISELTGFDRVLLYSFDEAGHGTVLTEVNHGVLPSYLGLRFPASDIPVQARSLYVLNTVRIIPDAYYVPSDLVGLPGETARTLDLSRSVLRSVSPIHVEYMKNMGTASSMSISIISEEKLWGLVSCHHSTPRSVPYLVRSACDMLTKIVGTQLTSFRNAAKLKTMVHFHAVQRRMLTEIAAAKDHVDAMARQMVDVRQVTAAAGAALLMEDQIWQTGETPPRPDLMRLADWLDGQPEMELFESRRLSMEIPWAESIAATASGLLAIRVSDVRRAYILWFRPEIVRTLNWAGEPAKIPDANQQLHPRRSFDTWKETVRGQSEPWTEMEIESAWDFRAALTTISLKRAEEAVEQSEQRFQQLTHVLPALVWTCNDQGELTYVNARWRSVGFPVSGPWFEVIGLYDEDQERLRRKWQEHIATGNSLEDEVRLHVGVEGRDRWHLVRIVPFRSSSGARVGWVGTSTDLTDRRDREAALRLTEKLATTGRMTSVIAHEINNPLESITNLMYLLRGEIGSSAPAMEYIGLVESELERISGITKQTLRWGRESTVQQQEATAGTLFDEVLRVFVGKIRNREVRVTVTGGREVVVHGVIGQLRQVLANLLSNAVDAVEVGGSVVLSASSQNGWTAIAVVDNGHGMEDAALQQLFQPFYSTKGDLGNGLGLYISHEIMERHHGTLDVESTVGVGTTITMRLPTHYQSRPDASA